jgi:hypothetical protein
MDKMKLAESSGIRPVGVRDRSLTEKLLESEE